MLKHSIKGTGKTIVFLHGWDSSSDVFRYFIDKLSATYTCVTIDMTAHNGQDEPQFAYDIYQYAFEVFLSLRKLDIDDFVLVGHSFGGRIAVILSSLFDIKIKAIMLVDSAGLRPKFSVLRELKVISYKILKWLVKHKVLCKKVLNKYGSSDYRALSVIMKKSFVKIVNEDLGYTLAQIIVPTLIFWGNHDKSTPLYMAKKFQKSIHNSGMIVVRGGHFSFLDDKNTFLASLSSFMESV